MLCKLVRETTQYVHHWTSCQEHVKEESLTDWLLHALDQSMDVAYVAFSRHEEARRTGADWEWWIVFAVGAVRLRVQAKKLGRDLDIYPSLAYSNAHGMQIDRLIQDALAVRALPLYAYYSAASKTGVRVHFW